MATLQSLQTQLDRVQTAIAEVEASGQSYSLGDVQYNRAHLSTLYKRERTLEKRISRLSGVMPTVKTVNFKGAGY